MNYDKSRIVSYRGTQYVSHISIMDLDPKSTKHFAKYLKQTESSLIAFKNAMNSVE